MMNRINIKNLRKKLIHLEETIIFALIERSLYKQNKLIYKKGGIKIPDFTQSFLDYILLGTEETHARAGRFNNPDEYPFCKKLPPAILNRSSERPMPKIKANKIKLNLNFKIKEIYINNIIPMICGKGNDFEFGSTAVSDVNALFALSKRIHLGIFIAESKFLSDPDEYSKLIKNKNRRILKEKLTEKLTEREILHRVQKKAQLYGQNLINKPERKYLINPEVIKLLYKQWIIPFTKEMELNCLLNRLSPKI